MDGCAPPLNLSTSVKVEDSSLPDIDALSFTVIGDNFEEDGESQGSGEQEISGDLHQSHLKEQEPHDQGNPPEYILPTKADLYMCNICCKSFKRATQLKTHQKVHAEDKVFECKACDDVFPDLASLNSHRAEHKNKVFKCDECGNRFSHLASLRVHQNKHLAEQPHQCQFCPQSFIQQSFLTIHQRVHTKERPFVCNECGAAFKQLSHLTTHVRIHTKDKPFQCKICGASFSQSSSLKRHARSHTGEKPFLCEVCNSSFAEKRNLLRHSLLHNGIKPFSCDQCSAKFTQRVDMQRHILSHSGARPYKCEECNASFSRKNNLKWHKLSHEGDAPFTCEICSARFAQLRDLKNHRKSHYKVDVYRCGVCKHTFNSGNALKRHQIVHSDNKPYPCEFCSSCFSEKNALKKHVLRKHNGVKSFSCPLCDMSFFEARTLKRHRVTIHGEDRYTDDVNDANELKIVDNLELLEVDKAKSQCSDVSVNKIIPEQRAANNVHDSLTVMSHHEENSCSTDVPSSKENLSPTNSLSHQKLASIITTSAPNDETMPTIVLSEPGQPPRTGRPANACQNHQDHILTFSGDSVNQWQAWCFCESSTSDEKIGSQVEPALNNLIASNSTDPNYITFTSSASESFIQPALDTSYASYPSDRNIEPKTVVSYPVKEECNGVMTAKEFQLYPNTYSGSVLQHCESGVIVSCGGQSEPTLMQSAVAETQQDLSKVALSESGLYPIPQLEQLQDHSIRNSQPEYLSVDSQPSKPVIQFSQTVSNPEAGEIQVQSYSFLSKDVPENSNEANEVKDKVRNKTSHKKSNPKEKCSYVCGSCNKAFSRINHLATHRRTHSGEKPFQCGICNQQFAHSNSIVIHMRSHTGEKPYTCPNCSATFTQQSNLRVHMRLHTGERPYKCDLCKREFIQQSHLASHRRLHFNERPFSCDECSMAFTQKSACNRHKLIHSGKQAFECKICGVKFGKKLDLRRHSRTHTNLLPADIVYPHKCCEKVFENEESLLQHMEVLHSNAAKNKTCTKSKPCVTVVGEKQGKNPEEQSDEKPASKDKDISKSVPLKPVKKVAKSNSTTDSSAPVRSSARIREAAVKKKIKDDSDYIVGDYLDEFCDDLKKDVIVWSKGAKQSKPDSNGELKQPSGNPTETVQSWCFCEVPHAPDEPHGIPRGDISPKSSGDPLHIYSSVPDECQQSNAYNPVHIPLYQNDDMRSSNAHLSETNVITMGKALSVQNMRSSSANGTITTSVQTVGNPNGSLVLPENQLINTDGTIYIDSEMLMNSTPVVLHPNQNALLCYVTNDCQVMSMPGSNSEAVLFQPVPSSSASDEGIPYITLPMDEKQDIQPESNALQPVSDCHCVEASIDKTDQDTSDTNIIVVKPTECSICNKQFAELRSHRKHMCEAHPNFLFCSKCCMAFTSAENLRAHDGVHCKGLSCETCGRSFNAKVALVRHRNSQKYCTPPKGHQYRCDLCPRIFKIPHELKRHKLSHTKEKLIRCNRCDASFSLIAELTRHTKTHDEAVELKCEFCSASFSQVYELSKHRSDQHQNEIGSSQNFHPYVVGCPE